MSDQPSDDMMLMSAIESIERAIQAQTDVLREILAELQSQG